MESEPIVLLRVAKARCGLFDKLIQLAGGTSEPIVAKYVKQSKLLNGSHLVPHEREDISGNHRQIVLERQVWNLETVLIEQNSVQYVLAFPARLYRLGQRPNIRL